eukprot:4140407-Pyramimonas_sp.AAC.1
MHRTRRCQRRRPPSWRRGPRSQTSAPTWTSTTPDSDGRTVTTTSSGTSFETKYPGALSEAAPFATLYRLQQAEEHILTGKEGPLWLFDDKRVGLLLAFLAAKWQELPLM